MQAVTSETIMTDVMASIGFECQNYVESSTAGPPPIAARPIINTGCTCFVSTDVPSKCGGTGTGVTAANRRLCCCNGGNGALNPMEICPTTGLTPIDGTSGDCDLAVPPPPTEKGWVLANESESCSETCGGPAFCDAGQLNAINTENEIESAFASVGVACLSFSLSELSFTSVSRPLIDDECRCYYSTRDTDGCDTGTVDGFTRLCYCNGGDVSFDPETDCPTNPDNLTPVEGISGFCDYQNPSSQPSSFPSVSTLPSIRPSMSSDPSSMPSVSQVPSETPTPSFRPSLSSMPSLSVQPSNVPSKSSAPSDSVQPSKMPSVSNSPSVSSKPSEEPSKAKSSKKDGKSNKSPKKSGKGKGSDKSGDTIMIT